MSKITDFAKGKPCTARIPGVCKHNSATSVWCHIRSVRWGSGTSEKPPDVLGLIGCSDCHDAIDGRTKKDREGNLLDPDFVKVCAYEGHMESLYLLHKAGIIP